jgi:hypothetical protein
MEARKVGWLLLGVTLLACSGRYDVGGMDATGATAGVGGDRGPAGGAAPASAFTPSMAGSTGMVPVGGVGSSSTSYVTADCLSASEPEPLAGPFAAPAVVWGRVARLIWGAAAPPPPSDLPATTTYEWAGSLAVTEIVAAHTTLGDAPGVDDFLRQWLGLDAQAPFGVRWGRVVPVPKPVLGTLLSTSISPLHTGIFTEPSWLSKYTTISARGASIERSLFAIQIPPEPDGLDTPPSNSNLTDRQALEVQVASPPCAACHRVVDPAGYALGHFAADGSYRALDHGAPIDTTGSRSANGSNTAIEFDGIEDFGQKYADTCEATRGFSTAFLLAALVINQARPEQEAALLEASESRVQQAFIAGGRTYLALVKAYVQSPAGLRP